MRRGLPRGTSAHRNLPYVADGHPRHRLDLYLPPAGRQLPLVIWIHGGGFFSGSKSDNVPFFLLAHGFAVASAGYRLSSDARFPAQIEDCKAAVRWLRAHAATFGIDAGHIGAWGESAGGHLAALLGATGGGSRFDEGDQPDQSSAVQSVVDFFGPTDFLQMDAHTPPGGLVHDEADSPESRLVGGPIQQMREQVASANPIAYLHPGVPPFLIVHGDQDPLVPHHQSELLTAALRRFGVPVTFYSVVGGGHGGFTDPAIAELVVAHLTTTLKLESS